MKAFYLLLVPFLLVAAHVEAQVATPKPLPKPIEAHKTYERCYFVESKEPIAECGYYLAKATVCEGSTTTERVFIYQGPQTKAFCDKITAKLKSLDGFIELDNPWPQPDRIIKIDWENIQSWNLDELCDIWLSNLGTFQPMPPVEIRNYCETRDPSLLPKK